MLKPDKNFNLIGIMPGPWLLAALLAVFPFSLHAGTAGELRNFLAVSHGNPAMPFLLLVGLVCAILTFFKPRVGLMIMLFFIMVSTDMQFSDQETESRAVTLRIEDLLLLLISGGWLINRAKTRNLAFFKSSPVNRAIMPMAVVIVICTIIGCLKSTTDMTRGFLFATKRIEYFWIFFMTTNIIDTEQEVKKVMHLMLGVAGIVACIGVAQFFIFPVSRLAAGGATATTGFGRANTFADFLLILIPVNIGFIIYEKERRRQVFFLCLLTLFSIALVMTKSRGAYLSVPPMVAVLIFFSRNRKMILSLVAIFLIGILYLLTNLLVTGKAAHLVTKHYNDIGYQFHSIGQVITEGTQADSSLQARVNAWKRAVPEIIDHPFFGHGVGSKRLGYYDNHYVRELYETGLVGLSAFLFMNAVIFFAALQLFRGSATILGRQLSLGVIGAQAGILVHAFTMSNFYTILNMETFWMLVAMFAVVYHNETRLRQNRSASETEPENKSVPVNARS